MTSKKFLVLLSASALLAGCKTEYKGDIQVLEPIQLSVKKGFKKGTKTLPAGQYGMELKATRKNRLKLEINAEGKNNDLVAYLQLAKGKKFSLGDGDFLYKANEIGQPYDIHGQLATVYSNGAEQYAIESCLIGTREVYSCETDSNGNESCGWHKIEDWGRQEVWFYNRHETQNLAFDLVKPADQSVVAKSVGRHTSSYRITTKSGPCL